MTKHTTKFYKGSNLRTYYNLCSTFIVYDQPVSNCVVMGCIMSEFGKII